MTNYRVFSEIWLDADSEEEALERGNELLRMEDYEVEEVYEM